MKIIGLYWGHDSNVCLFEDGECVLLVEKERMTRKRHDQGHMLNEMPAIFELAGWKPEDVDFVVFNPHARPTLDGQAYQFQMKDKNKLYTDYPSYNSRPFDGTVDDRWSRHKVDFNGRDVDAIAIDHHLAHVAGAYYTSPFDEAGIISADGGGDFRYCVTAHAKGNRIESIDYGWGADEAGVQLNIGSVWASVGEYQFGWQRLEGAGKLMGLAAYGRVDKLLLEAIERQSLHHAMYDFPCYLFHQPQKLNPEMVWAQNLAASLQQFTTDAFIIAAKRLTAERYAPNLCLTGGCAMNCIANTAVHETGMFEDTYVPAQPHDGGLSLGMCQFVWHDILGNPRKPRLWSPFLGTDAGELKPEWIPEIVKHLNAGKTVGLCHGRAESGPRALGHRSILADPRNKGIREQINNKVKFREWFRPFAPMVRGVEGIISSPYMSYVTTVPEGLDLPGIAHVDGTTRPQTSLHGDKFLQELFSAWHGKTGCNWLLNTSFNSQEPLVDTTEHAQATFERTDLDVLVTRHGIETKKKARIEVSSGAAGKVAVLDNIRTFSGAYIEALQGAGFQVDMAESNTWVKLVNRADVVWFEWANNPEILNYVANLKSRPKVVVRLHAYELHDGLAQKMNWDVVDKLVVVSEPYKVLVGDRLQVNKKAIEVIPVGIDLDRIELVKKENANAGVRRTVLWLGSINFKKGANLLPLIARQLPRHRFLVAGPIQDSRIYDLIKHTGPENLEYRGALEQHQLNDYFAEGAYLLNCSLRESFGVAIGEGMVAGCRPLVYDWPGASEIWGQRYVWSDIAGLAKTIREPLRSAGYRRSVIRRGYGLENCTNRFVDVFKKLVPKKRKRK